MYVYMYVHSDDTQHAVIEISFVIHFTIIVFIIVIFSHECMYIHIYIFRERFCIICKFFKSIKYTLLHNYPYDSSYFLIFTKQVFPPPSPTPNITIIDDRVPTTKIRVWKLPKSERTGINCAYICMHKHALRDTIKLRQVIVSIWKVTTATHTNHKIIVWLFYRVKNITRSLSYFIISSLLLLLLLHIILYRIIRLLDYDSTQRSIVGSSVGGAERHRCHSL